MLILFVIYVVIGVVSATPRSCCSPESVMLKKNTLCWNPRTNVTANITTLSCQHKVKLMRYLINSEDRLVLTQINNRNISIANDSFCLGNQTTRFDVQMKNLTEVAVLCTGEDEKVVDDKLSGYCMIVSVIFLFLVAIIYTMLAELRDLQGKSIASFCLSLGLGMMVLIIMKLMEYSDMKLCAVRGFLAYFFILSSFFWTNAISIQILLSLRRPTTVNYGMREYLWYATYAWGIPTILTMAMALVNFLPGDHPKPGIGLMHCWFYDTANQWYYMYSVMSILIVANIAIFIYTSVVLWRNSFKTTHLKALRYKFMMTVRLFVLMGVTWIFEMISSSVETTIVWAVIDIYNTLQGLLIFLVLVMFRRRAIRALYKHGWLDCISGSVEKHLAVGEDDEQDVIEHTKDVPLEENK